MPPTETLPSLSELLTWPTEHLTEGADHWEATNSRWYGVFHRIWRDSISIDWTGQASEQLHIRTYKDMIAVSEAGDQLQAAAKIARIGASDLYAARSRVRYMVEDARSAGFDVGEDLSISDRSTGGTPATWAALKIQAETFAAGIRQRAFQLVRLDQHIAERITTALAGLGDITFDEATVQPSATRPEIGRHDGLQLVDNKTWKDTPDPPPTPSPGLTAGDLREAINDLPQGNRPFIREIRSEIDLRKLLDWLSQGAAERNPASSYKGTERVLIDGTIVGIRQDPEYGLTMDIRSPDKGYVRIHINPTRGDAPNTPGLSGKPGLPGALEPAPPVRAPVEPPPVRAPAARPATPPPAILGPIPPESKPHPVQLPHSHHELPVLGKDDLSDLDEFGPG